MQSTGLPLPPFDLNSNGKLEELELNEEAQLAILDHPPVGKFDFVVLMPLVFILNMVGVTIWPAFSYVYPTLSKPSSIRAEQPLLYEPCVECSNELEYNTALIGPEGICQTAKPTSPSPLLLAQTRDNNTLHTEPRAARLLETMMFAAARRTSLRSIRLATNRVVVVLDLPAKRIDRALSFDTVTTGKGPMRNPLNSDFP